MQYVGTAPVEMAGAERSRQRLSRCGDRRLNVALHTVAITQIRMPGTRGHTCCRRKFSEGKTSREAERCLGRRPADRVWRVMICDGRRSGRRLSQTA
ncbi:transposase [Streptomyces sp. NBC_01007]|nr:transposase [Streptomyces sp. NBC_01007]WRZ95671.1 transposase [Streptomyces sp. NBC_01007]